MNKKFLPRKLVEAREFRGFTQTYLGNEIGAKKQSISFYEKAINSPTVETVLKISKALDFPMMYFYTQNEYSNINDTTEVFFRKFNSATKTQQVMAKRRLAWICYFYSLQKKHFSLPPVNIKPYNKKIWEKLTFTEIEDIANNTRKMFGIGDGAISNVIRLLENNGAIIGSFAIANSLDAFSLWSNISGEETPIILIDKIKESPARLRFNVAHELGHLVLHKTVNKDDLDNKEQFKKIELQANYFAGAFLIPKKHVLVIPENINIEQLMYLKRDWGVSIQAIIMRMNQLGIINNMKKESLYKRLSSIGYTKYDPVDNLIEMEEPSVLKKMFSHVLENPKEFADIVNRITSFPVNDLLEIFSLTQEQLNNAKEKNIVISFPQAN